MNKKELLDLGIEDEELAQKIIIAHGKDIEKHKSDIDNLQTERDSYKEQIDAMTKELEGYKDMDVEAIKASAAEWQQKAEKIEQEMQEKLQTIKFENALEGALKSAKVRNVKAVKPLLNMKGIAMQEDGTLAGLNEQLEKIKESDDYLFEDSDENPPAKIVTGSKNKTVNTDSVLAAVRAGAGLDEE
jgi:predicted  nucleic acid-binding Zn-ribbon protein